MRELNLSQEKLAERLDVTAGAVGHWLREDRTPKMGKLNQMLVEIGLPPFRMVFPHELAENAGAYGVVGGLTPGADGEQYEVYCRYPILRWDSLDQVPENCARQATDHEAKGRAFWLRVEGDAMTAPVGLSVPEGMLILVDSGVAAEPGKLLIARSPDSTATVFRQLIEEGGQRYLKPLNPTYPKALFTEQTEVLGVVVQALVKF